MQALGGFFGNNGGWWRRNWESESRLRRRSSSKGSKSSDITPGKAAAHFFPFKQAITAGSLALTGDTIAQLRERWMSHIASKKQNLFDSDDSNENSIILLDHDWIRALRMTSYGFLFYGPGSYAWYRYLDYCMPKQTVENLMLKILLNQIVLGPCVIAVVFAWNNLWQGKLSQLPAKYRKDALPTLLYGFRFWIPVSALNFSVIPLQGRVAFMSMGSIFWNFYLSSTMSK